MSCERDGIVYCEDVGGIDTPGHGQCFTRIPDNYSAQEGELNASGCDVGCRSCLDYPYDIIKSAAHHGDLRRRALRYLRSRTTDARAKIHTLRASIPHLCAPFGRYIRAACHGYHTAQDGAECWGDANDPLAERPCTCYPDPPTSPDPGTNTCDGTPFGWKIRAIYGDGTFYTDRWPPKGHSPYAGGDWQSMQCKRFWEQPTNGVRIRSQRGNTMFLRSAVSHDACAPDWLVAGAGYVVNSQCDSGYAHGWWDVVPQIPVYHSGHLYELYMSSNDTDCIHLFDQVMFHPEATFAELDDPVLDPRNTTIRNRALEMIRDDVFQDTPTSMRFDMLDHEAPQHAGNVANRYLGIFSREWDMRRAEDGVYDSRIPVVAEFNHSKTRLYGLDVEADLVMVRVKCELDLQLYHAQANAAHGGWVNGWRRDTVAPHCIARIRAWFGLRVKSIDGDLCSANYTPGNAARWPDISPHGNYLELAQEAGQFFQPVANLDWHGVLNDFSKPSLREQGFKLEDDPDDENPWSFGRLVTENLWDMGYGEACKAAATVASGEEGWTIRARQGIIDNDPEDEPENCGFVFWDGNVQCTFVGTPGYEACCHG